MKPRIPRAIALALLLGAVAAAAWPANAAAEDCPSDLRIPDGQDSYTCTIEDWSHREEYAILQPATGGVLISKTPFLVSGSGPIEVILKLEETIDDDNDVLPGEFELAILGEVQDTYGELRIARMGKVYRSLFMDPDLFLLGVFLALTGDAGQSPMAASDFNSMFDNRADLTVIVRRLPMQCSMWAHVSGDVNGSFFGDVAYYLHSTSGVMVDPEGMAALGLLLGLSGKGDQAADDFASAMAREMSGHADQDDEEGGGTKKKTKKKYESIGLVLQDFKIDQALPYEPEAGAKQDQASQEVAALLAGQFGLGLRASLIPTPDGTVEFRIDGGSATVGAVVQGAGDRISFELIEGKSGAKLSMLPYPGTDMAYGTFTGDLYTRHKYTLGGGPEHQLHVHINANFTAMKGQFTCAKR